MMAMSTLPLSTKAQILLAAERLFAERGYDGVSLREIGAAAGSGNNSAVQYHFGSREQLVVAIFDHRLSYIDERRGLLIAQLQPADLRSWLECYVLPLLEQGEMEGSHYMSFIAAVEQQPTVLEQLPDRFRSRTETFRREVGALMPDVPEPLRSHRIFQVLQSGVHAAAFRETTKVRGLQVLPFAIHVADLLDGWAGFLAAPVSDARARIDRRPDEKRLGLALPAVMASTPSVGFIGLGSQGGPMARRIVDDEFPLTVWARRAETLEAFLDSAATTAASPAALAEASEIVCVCVTGDADVEQVVLGPHGVLGALEPGAILVIHSTVHPQTCIRLSEIAAERDVALLDAPVSGGGHAAAQRALLVMVGGDLRILERVRPILATFGDPILHLGQVGAGQTAKLVNNVAFTAQISLALEVFTLVEQLGVDRAAMARVLERGAGEAERPRSCQDRASNSRVSARSPGPFSERTSL